MQRHDSAEIKGPFDLELLSGTTGAYVLVFEMALTRDSRGRWCDNLNMCRICLAKPITWFDPGYMMDEQWMNRLSFRLGPGNTMDKRDIIRCPFRCPFMQRLCIWNCTALLLGLDIDNPLHRQKYRHCKDVHALQHILKYTLYILREMANCWSWQHLTQCGKWTDTSMLVGKAFSQESNFSECLDLPLWWMSKEICRTTCWEAGKVFKLKHISFGWFGERETSIPKKPKAQRQRLKRLKFKGWSHKRKVETDATRAMHGEHREHRSGQLSQRGLAGLADVFMPRRRNIYQSSFYVWHLNV
jgi:hypothetical protein